ncbi:hypothetical protein H9657_16160 [Cellulomonas sp. Sa3CUA2]|uniref:Asp23/Gls24 family envelope stress response protein n=1 Tax=Cellulomonas avistercoris TaxID=2762242 RepID=A0ABR8QHA1_9CELL|nr:hypothetical protein [Cellulomonas avistercoris]MBD7919806.1 hypothetical protein [Cellulomonas avistercoris]
MAVNERRSAEDDGLDLLHLATAHLRRHTDDGWVAVAPRVLASALAALRTSHPVRGRHAEGDYTVADGVLRTSVRTLLDGDPRLRVSRVAFRTDARGVLEQAVVELSAAYLQPIAPLAADVRTRVAGHLRDVLGDPGLPDAMVSVDLVVTDVHRP